MFLRNCLLMNIVNIIVDIYILHDACEVMHECITSRDSDVTFLDEFSLLIDTMTRHRQCCFITGIRSNYTCLHVACIRIRIACSKAADWWPERRAMNSALASKTQPKWYDLLRHCWLSWWVVSRCDWGIVNLWLSIAQWQPPVCFETIHMSETASLQRFATINSAPHWPLLPFPSLPCPLLPFIAVITHELRSWFSLALWPNIYKRQQFE